MISVFIETNAPLATSKRQPELNTEEREQLLNTFTRTVFGCRPPVDIAYRCMRLDLWSWTEGALVDMELRPEATLDDMLRLYLDTLKASRNAERLFHLWRASKNFCPDSGLKPEDENFVVTEKSTVPPNETCDSATKRILNYTNPNQATLSDWFYVGMATEGTQQGCRSALCRKVVSFCNAASATMVGLLEQKDRIKEVVAVILQHTAAAAPVGYPVLSSMVKKSKTGPEASLDAYRNIFEAPLMQILSQNFSSPGFFGWVDFPSTTLHTKRHMAQTVLEFAQHTLHPTSVGPLLTMYLSTIFVSPVECMGSEHDVAQRLSSGNFLGISLDASALASFSPALRRDGLDHLTKSVRALIQECGMCAGLVALHDSIEAVLSNISSAPSFVNDALKCLRVAFEESSRVWGRHTIDFLVNAAHDERHPDGSGLQQPSPVLSRLWALLKGGVALDRFEPCYASRLIQRISLAMTCSPQPSVMEGEGCFAELFFPVATCPLLYSHRTRQLIRDFGASTQLTDQCHVVMSEAPPASVTVLSRAVAQEFLDKVTLPFLPKSLEPMLDVASLVYSSMYQPCRSVSWLAYRSQVTIADRPTEGSSSHPRVEYVMSLAHFAVLEAAEAHSDVPASPLSTRQIAEYLGGVNAQHVMVLVDDLMEAGLLEFSATSSDAVEYPVDATVVVVNQQNRNAARAQAVSASCEQQPRSPNGTPEPTLVVNVQLLSARRVARLRKKQEERFRPSLECALMKVFKSGISLPLDSVMIIPHLLPLLPARFVVNPQEVEQAVVRLLARNYLSLHAPTNVVSYLA